MGLFRRQEQIWLSLVIVSLLSINGYIAVAGESIWQRYGSEPREDNPVYQPAVIRVCIVADPTDTPLNVRSTPRGKIIGSLPDGAKVELWEGSSDGKWVYIYTPVMEGYVWAAYLKC